MKFVRTVLVSLLSVNMQAILATASESNLKASNPAILPQGQAVLDYLSGLSTSAHHRIIVGQWVSGRAQWPMAYTLFVQNLYNSTGKSVALLGSDYDPRVRPAFSSPLASPPAGTAEQSRALSQLLINQWKAGGLVTLTWLVDNPWRQLGTGDFCASVPAPCVPGNLTDLIHPENPAGAYYQGEMDILATNLQALQDAGVVVLFRPFNEMNGNWFWWGAQTAQSPTQDEFRTLWRYTYNYLTKVKHLNNLLWVFSPANSELQLTLYPSWNGLKQPAPYYYPGEDFVDVTGLDVYVNRLTAPPNPPVDGESNYSLPTYDQMIALGKPFGFAEFGPKSSERQEFDFDAMIHDAVPNYPKVGFFMAWQDDPGKHKYFSIVGNPGAKELMNDPLIITRDAVHY